MPVLLAALPAPCTERPARRYWRSGEWTAWSSRADRRRSGVKPLLVLEQGPEHGTPQTIEIAEAQRRSCRYAREVFSRSFR